MEGVWKVSHLSCRQSRWSPKYGHTFADYVEKNWFWNWFSIMGLRISDLLWVSGEGLGMEILQIEPVNYASHSSWNSAQLCQGYLILGSGKHSPRNLKLFTIVYGFVSVADKYKWKRRMCISYCLLIQEENKKGILKKSWRSNCEALLWRWKWHYSCWNAIQHAIHVLNANTNRLERYP